MLAPLTRKSRPPRPARARYVTTTMWHGGHVRISRMDQQRVIEAFAASAAPRPRPRFMRIKTQVLIHEGRELRSRWRSPHSQVLASKPTRDYSPQR